MKFKLITGTDLTLERALNEWAAQPAPEGKLQQLISTQFISHGEGFAVLIAYLQIDKPKDVQVPKPPTARRPELLVPRTRVSAGGSDGVH